MSASNIEINNIAVDANAPADNKKPRKPSLPAKFGKFIQFAYYLCNNINASNPGAIDKERFLESIQLFAAVDDQQAFVQGFFDNAKGINAEIRTLLTARNRAAAKAAKDALKTPKIKKTKNIATTHSDATTDAPAKKTKKTKKPPVTNDFVNDIVQLALGNSTSEEHTNTTNENVVLEIVHDEPTATPMIGGGGGGGGISTDTPTDSNAKPVKQPKTTKQPKAKTEQNATPATTVTATAETATATATADSNAKPVKEPKTKTPKESKSKTPKTPKEPKTKTPKAPKPTATPVLSDNDDDDDAELEVEPFSLNGVDYLLDDRNNNLYHPTSHLLVGSLSYDKLSIL